MPKGKKNFGIKPFVLRDEFHYFIYPAMAFGGGHTFDKFWEGHHPSDEILRSLSRDERLHCEREFTLGWDCFLNINERLYFSRDVRIDKEVLFKLIVLRTDLYTVVALCKYLDELWNSLYHGHQAAEKALKAYLLSKKATDKELKSLGHNLRDILDCCIEHNQEFSKFTPLLPTMVWKQEWRYEPYNFDRDRIVYMFNGALQMLAQVVFEIAKESESELRPIPPSGD